MDPYGKFDPVTTFETVKLKKQQNGHSWSIIGYLSSDDFRILGVLEEPISHVLMVIIAKQIAEQFKASFQGA